MKNLYGNSASRRIIIGIAIALLAGCVVESPQPTPPPTKPGPPVTTPTVPVVPRPVEPAPKVYSGSYIDRLEADSRDRLAATSVKIQRNSSAMKLTIPAGVVFALRSAELQPRFLPTLDVVSHLCRDYGKTTIVIRGYTDSTGSFEYNQTLSEQRAQAIAAYLGRENTTSRIRAAGYGPRNPIADNKSDEGRALNRRIEIEMVINP